MKTITTTQTELQLTEKEIIFLQTMITSDFWENDLESTPWDYSVNDFLPYSGKTRSGVISSLVQKNVIGVYQKQKGDIAGNYWLTDEARVDPIVLAIVKPEAVENVTETKTGVRKVGDLHKNGLWVWKQTKSGKFDWRVIRKGALKEAPKTKEPIIETPKKLSEDKIREALAESGKIRVSDMMSYLETFHKGNYNKALAKKNATELVKEMKSYL